MKNYETETHDTPIETNLPHDLVICGPPPPSSFVITQAIVAVMAGQYRRLGYRPVINIGPDSGMQGEMVFELAMPSACFDLSAQAEHFFFTGVKNWVFQRD